MCMAQIDTKQRAIYLSKAGFSPQAVAGVLGVDLTDVKTLMSEANPEVELPGGTAVETPVLVATAVLTDEQIKALTSPVPVEIVSVEEGKVAVPLLCILRFESPAATGYGNLGGQSLGVGVQSPFELLGYLLEASANASAKVSGLLGDFEEKTAVLAAVQDAGSSSTIAIVNDVPAGPLSLWMEESGAELTGGDLDNTLTVQVAYMEMSTVIQ